MSNHTMSLDELWQVRNAAAETLGLCETQMDRATRSASIDDLIALIETFSPALSTGPEWTRTFEPLVKRLWTWCDSGMIARLAAAFRARGAPWIAVTNALSVEHGAAVGHGLRHTFSADDRCPAS